MSNKLKDEIEKLIPYEKSIALAHLVDKHYSLIGDVAVKYQQWYKKSGKNDLSRYFKTLYPPTEQQSFQYFIENIYSK